MNLFVFDIETIPDTDAGRKLLHLPADLSDVDVATAMTQKQLEKNGSDFLPHHLQKVVAISTVYRHKQQVKVWSLGSEESGESDLIERFFKAIEKVTPTLITWNGSGFDLPVLHYRALLHKVIAPRYWEVGEDDNSFKWNNYLNRYHYRHTDLMDVLAGYTGRANARLDDIALMLGFPGKMGQSGATVFSQYHKGHLKAIRDYCETDVLNTYLVYLRYELMRGRLSTDEHTSEELLVKQYLTDENKPHFNQFVNAWENNSN